MSEKIQNKTILDKVIVVSLMVLNALFFVYLGILAYFSQLHYDDLHFLWEMRENSIFAFVKHAYLFQSGRFVGYALNGIKSVITDALGFHQLWSLLYYVLGIGMCWLVVKDVKFNVSKIGLFMCVCFLYNLYILSNIDFPVFFWLCAMAYYLYFPMACLLLKYLNMEKLNWWQWMLWAVMVVLIGGGNEAFTPMVLLLMLVCGLYWWHSKEWKVKETWALPQVRRIVWTAVIMLVLLAIVVAAPGNYQRMAIGADGEGFAHPDGILGWIKAETNAVSMFFYFMVFYIPYYLVAFALAYYLGCKSEKQLPLTKGKLVMGLSIGFVVYLLFSALPNVYIYNGFGIQRTYTHVVFALLLTVASIGFVLGVGRKPAIVGRCSIAGLIAFVVIMCVNIVKDTPTAQAYGNAVNERIEYLCMLRDKGNKETVTVAPLPVPYTEDPKHLILGLVGKETTPSMLYYISETDTIPNEYESHLKRVLNLDFDFVLPKEGIKNRECE